MTMDYHHQLDLLKDILANQLDEHYGTHGEFHQLQSLVQSLVQNTDVPEDLKQTLYAIEQYTYDHDKEGEHTTMSSLELTGWIQQVNNVNQRTF